MDLTPEKQAALLELEGARVDAISIGKNWIAIDLRHKGTDDGAMRIEFMADASNAIPWNPVDGDFRA